MIQQSWTLALDNSQQIFVEGQQTFNETYCLKTKNAIVNNGIDDSTVPGKK